MLARRPSIQENGRDIAIALDPIFETCPSIKLEIHMAKGNAIYKRSWTYKKLLKKTKVSQHVDNDKNGGILQNPVEVLY